MYQDNQTEMIRWDFIKMSQRLDMEYQLLNVIFGKKFSLQLI